LSTYPAISAGQRITGSLLTSMLPIVVYKSAAEGVTSSTTLQNDDELFAALEANATYIMDGYLQVRGAAPGSGDIKIDFTLPTGAGLLYTSFGAVATSPAVQYEATVNAASTARSFATNASTDMGAAIHASIIMGTTAGTVQLRWAQATSSATTTYMLGNSWLRFTRIA
jgi:hypothetical protein